MIDTHRKVTSEQLSRKAFLYVRQSTVRQVFHNTESTRRQYDLRHRAVALGWSIEQVIIIDADLGKSGASAADREGFQRLVTEVGLGNAGVVMGLEVSRLARNCSDWHRLIEICALTKTLILDEDGLYDPALFNDRLLLGLKGAMSEAELHVLKARLQGGILNKARRGELEIPLPIGFIYTASKQVVFDPNARIVKTIQTFFTTYHRVGSASATVREFRTRNLQFPSRPHQKGAEALWRPLTHSRSLQVLHNPRYAGAFAFGRTQVRQTVSGKRRFRRLPREEWIALIPNVHEGYISWQEFENNQKRLRENSAAYGSERRSGPPREGNALLQGIVICGICGKRMTVRYNTTRAHNVVPIYVCQSKSLEHSLPICQSIPGAMIDNAIGKLVLELMTPMTIDIAFMVQEEINGRTAQFEELRAKAVEQARYEAELARRRYMHVDPENRLVANSLEAEWNEKLRDLAVVVAEHETQKKQPIRLAEQQKAMVQRLVENFPSLWNDPNIKQRERKRLLRLLIEDVTLRKTDRVAVDVRLRGGQTRSLSLPRAIPAWKIRQTDPDLVAEVDRLLDKHIDKQIVAILNERGYHSGEGLPITLVILRHLKRAYKLKSLRQRLVEKGLLTLGEIAEKLSVSKWTVMRWRSLGLLVGYVTDGRGNYLYEDPGPNPPRAHQNRQRKEISKQICIGNNE